MNTIIPIFIHHDSTPPEDPKCPHCKKKLKGWIAPSEASDAVAFLLALALLILLALQVGGLIFGIGDGQFERCEPFGEKRYHYLFPGYVAGCAATRWFMNKEVIFSERNKD